ncbi:MAG: hypothetical protein ABI599_11255 [Flavobacteriales bacterium]
MNQRMKNVLGSLVLACLGGPVAAQTLADWKTASENRGAESIPYPDERNLALRKREVISEYCKSIEWGCTGTRELRANIASMPTGIDNMKRERDQLSDKRNASTSDDERKNYQNSMDELTRKIDDTAKRLEDMKYKFGKEVEYMRDNILVGQRCLSAREETTRIFNTVIAKAGNETDPEVKNLVGPMVSRWEQGNRDHAGEIQKVKDAIANCEKCRDGDK